MLLDRIGEETYLYRSLLCISHHIFHYFAEIVKAYFPPMLGICLLYNFMYLLLSNFAALPVEHLSKALLREKSRVVHVEVMERKHEILHS